MLQRVSVPDEVVTNVFHKVLELLNDYDIRDVAFWAEINIGTLYNWKNKKVKVPHLRTLSKVAYVLGYKIELVAY